MVSAKLLWGLAASAWIAAVAAERPLYPRAGNETSDAQETAGPDFAAQKNGGGGGSCETKTVSKCTATTTKCHRECCD